MSPVPPPSIPLLTAFGRPGPRSPRSTDLEYCSIRLQKIEAAHAFAMRVMAGRTGDIEQ
jgi:hypothetical protein